MDQSSLKIALLTSLNPGATWEVPEKVLEDFTEMGLSTLSVLGPAAFVPPVSSLSTGESTFSVVPLSSSGESLPCYLSGSALETCWSVEVLTLPGSLSAAALSLLLGSRPSLIMNGVCDKC